MMSSTRAASCLSSYPSFFLQLGEIELRSFFARQSDPNRTIFEAGRADVNSLFPHTCQRGALSSVKTSTYDIDYGFSMVLLRFVVVILAKELKR